MDSNFPCSKEGDSEKTSSGMEAAVPAQPELKGASFDPSPNVDGTQNPSISEALDLSKKDNSAENQGPVILDLSLRNSSSVTQSSDPEINKQETCVSGEQTEATETSSTLVISPMGQQKVSTFHVSCLMLKLLS